MKSFGKMPPYILSILADEGVNAEGILLTVYFDRDNSFNYADCYAVLTEDSLYILSGFERLSVVGLKEDGLCDFVLTGFNSYPVNEIARVEVDEMLSTARLVAVTPQNQYILLSSFSNFCKASAVLFAKYFMRLKKGEISSVHFTLDEEDEPEFRCCPKCKMRYPDKNRKVCPRCMEKGKLFRRFSVFLKKYSREIVILFLSLILLTATAIAVPYFSKGFFLDNVLSEGGSLFGEVTVAVLIVAAVQALSQIADMINGYISTKISAKVVFDLKKTIFSSIEKLSMSFFSARQTGGLMTQVNDDSNTIYSFFCDIVPYFLINIIQIAILIAILVAMSPWLALITLSTVPIFFYLIRKTYGTSKKLNAVKYSATRNMSSGLSDVIGGIRVVKAFAKEEKEAERFNKANRFVSFSSKRLSLFNNYTSPAVSYVLHIGNILCLGLGGYMVMKGKLSYGELITFTAFINMIYNPLLFFSHMVNHTSSCANALQRLFEIYDTEPEITERENAVQLENIRGEIEFRNVDFGYTKHRKVIDNVSFVLGAGKSLGIVGHTGAGKSTIANLIIRLYDADEGSIFIDGVNVRDLSFKTLYDNVAIVSQETYLFIGSILDNIRYACPNATYEEVIKASKCAGAHDFIMKLPDAYNTKIGLGFHELSGGERQRISIARAILRNPKILILDEATAAMDTKTERTIQNALTNLTRNKTTIMIAHRLSTLRDVDELIVIEHGRVVERGTHSSLLKIENGVYNRLFTMQTKAMMDAGIIE